MIPVSHDHQNSNLNDPEWHFLGEYPLKGSAVDGEIPDRSVDGMLRETISCLGIGAELIDNIERKLIGFVDGALAQRDQGRFETPATIRIFCQKKTKEHGNSMKSSIRLNKHHANHSVHNFLQSHPAVNGGWGYFLVKRGEGPNHGSSANTNIRIDLFIYNE